MRLRVRPEVTLANKSRPVQSGRARRLDLVFCVALVGFTLLSFWPCLANDFNYDDTACLLDNLHYRGLGATQLRWMFSTFHMGHYQPLTWVSFGLDYLLWGTNAWGYHLTSLTLHCANAVLVYWLALCLIRRAAEEGAAPGEPSSWRLPASAFVAALVFAVHPLRVESIAWATDRADVLSTFFLLLCTLAYLRAARAGSLRSRAGWLITAVALYACGLLSRGMGVPLPLVLLLLDWYPLRRLGSHASLNDRERFGSAHWEGEPPAAPRLRGSVALPRRGFAHTDLELRPSLRSVLLEKIPFVILAAAAAILAPLAKADEGLTIPLAEHGILGRIAQACYGLVFYAHKTLVPTGLVPIYELRPPLEIATARYLLPLLLVLALGVALVRYWRRWPGITVALLSYAVLVSPLLGLVQAGRQEVADRYVYWPGISLVVLLGGGCFTLLRRHYSRVWVPRLVFSVFGVAIALLGTLSWRQSLVWRSEESLWTHAVRHGPVCSAAHYNLGYVYANDGRVPEAMAQFELGRQINPKWGIAQLLAGKALARAHAWQEASQIFRSLLALEPHHAGAAIGLGEALAALRQPVEAESAFRRALQVEPNSADAWFGLGNALVAQGRVAEAADAFQRTIQLAPHRANAHENLGSALAQMSRIDEAEAHLRRALELDPDYFEGYMNLAQLLQMTHRLDDAADVLETAVRLRPEHAEARRRLATLNQQRGSRP
jgi:tetratricopeptide (TPR) repeat protein